MARSRAPRQLHSRLDQGVAIYRSALHTHSTPDTVSHVYNSQALNNSVGKLDLNFSTTPISIQASYSDEYQAYGNRILLPDSAEILPKVASEKEQEAAFENK